MVWFSTMTIPSYTWHCGLGTCCKFMLGNTKNYIINPHTNGLSDHEAQIIVIENIVLTKQINNVTTKRDINDQSILEFQLLLSYENWEDIFMEDDANTSFNTFLNIYLRIFHSCFIKKCTNFKNLF